MTTTASSGSPPEGSKPEDATPPKPRRPPRASAATTARGTTSTPPKPTTPPPSARAAGAARRAAPVSPGTASPGTPGGLSVARGFDRELTRDFAKRESALRFEVERWRARAEALTEENETFRASVETARRRNADAEGHFALQSRELDRLRAQAVGEGAARAARLEEQCERQRRMLRELAVASEALAKDNVLLSSELVALRDRGDEAESLAETLSERLRSARKLYLANQKSLARAEETRASLPDGRWEKKLNELLTADVLARSKPPPAFPAETPTRAPLVAVAAASDAFFLDEKNASFGVAKAVPGSLVQERRKLHEENAALRKSLAKTQSLVTELREQKVLTGAELAAARRDSGAKARTLQAQLAGAARRLRWLVERVDALEASAREKDAYAASLERRLLAQHRTMGEMTRAVGAETRRREARERSAKKTKTARETEAFSRMSSRGRSGSPDGRSGDGDPDSGERSRSRLPDEGSSGRRGDKRAFARRERKTERQKEERESARLGGGVSQGKREPREVAGSLSRLFRRKKRRGLADADAGIRSDRRVGPRRRRAYAHGARCAAFGPAGPGQDFLPERRGRLRRGRRGRRRERRELRIGSRAGDARGDGRGGEAGGFRVRRRDPRGEGDRRLARAFRGCQSRDGPGDAGDAGRARGRRGRLRGGLLHGRHRGVHRKSARAAPEKRARRENPAGQAVRRVTHTAWVCSGSSDA